MERSNGCFEGGCGGSCDATGTTCAEGWMVGFELDASGWLQNVKAARSVSATLGFC